MARRRMSSTARTWAIRAAIGLGSGLVLGFVIGAITVRVMQPAVVIAPDGGRPTSTRRTPVAREAEDNGQDGQNTSSSENEMPVNGAPVNGIRVPQLVGMEEGDARKAILRSGFAVGSVTFKASSEPLGRVVESIPVPGEAVVLPAMVSLILSDGKGRPDSLSNFSLR